MIIIAGSLVLVVLVLSLLGLLGRTSTEEVLSGSRSGVYFCGGRANYRGDRSHPRD
jgi:hypothetical protein